MEDTNVEKLTRKELLQLCIENKIRTAGVKQDDLVRLLQHKLQSPASSRPRLIKTSSQTSTTEAPPMTSKPKAHNRTSSSESLPSSSQPMPRSRASSTESLHTSSLPKGRVQLGTDSQTPSKDTRGKISVRNLSMRSAHQGGSQRSPVDDPFRKDSPEQSRKEASSISGLPLKPTLTKIASAPTQRSPSDLLRKKASTLSGIGKQVQERQPKQSDRSSVRSRDASLSGIGKQAQERRPKQSDSSSIRSRSNIGTPRQTTRSTSITGKHPGQRTPVALKINEAQKASSSADAYSEAANSPRASEAGVIDNSDQCSVYSFCSVSEVATDAGHQYMDEDSDADDGRSVSSEPASRFVHRTNKFTPRTSTLGSRMDQGACPPWETVHERNFLDSSVKSSALNGQRSKYTEPTQDEDVDFSHFLRDTDSLLSDADNLDSFLDSSAVNPGNKSGAEGQRAESEQMRTLETSTSFCYGNETIPSAGASKDRSDDVIFYMSEAALPASHSASKSGDDLFTVHEMAPVSTSVEIDHTNEVVLPVKVAIGDSASQSKDSDPTVATMDVQHESKSDGVSDTLLPTIQKTLFHVNCDEFNSVEQAITSSSNNREDSGIIMAESDAPVEHLEHDDTVSSGILVQEGDVVLAPNVVRPDIAVSVTVASTVEKPLLDVDCDKFDSGHQTVEQGVKDGKSNEENNNTAVAPEALPEHCQYTAVVTVPFQQQVQIATSKEPCSIVDSNPAESKFSREESLALGALIDCTINPQESRNPDDSLEKVVSQTITEKHLCYGDFGDCPIPAFEEEPAASSVLPGNTDHLIDDLPSKDHSTLSSVDTVENHSNTDDQLLSQLGLLNTSSVLPTCNNLPESSPRSNMTESMLGHIPPEPQIMSSQEHSPIKEQEDSDIKSSDGPCASDCGPLPDFNKDEHELKVGLLEERHKKGNSLAMRRLPFSIFLWCSQLISSIFGYRRSQRP
ncbi:uncharacterized protein [Physcomitrium patens]|uniref:Uncharacterized protein n=1 Tax=Physcomitrium patens TaxID=3218 RepID=A0A2K1J2U3_PHYPA|nr:uncharacterized protein LOC112294178 isoform X1 [Physcomitrium patens]PNR35841.1 hypothetical protein PHYPA_021691 [Physcomitrium patens]|eukprot:XP_024400166.1 uncharacterized protein LOC112294178 isoform X1 [Physcomitrella patens]